MKKNKPEYHPILFSHVYKNTPWGGSKISTFRDDVDSKDDKPIGESWEIVDRPESQSVVQNGKYEGLTIREIIEKDPEGFVAAGHKAESPFPLLFKIIDAQKDLSLQVHPDENCSKFLDNAEAKSEMWYVLDHRDDAQILKGLKKDVSLYEFISHLQIPDLKEMLNSFKSENGDSFMIHGNTVHSIGGGNLIYEIQQNSNTTYRVSDWGRNGMDGKPRELHIDQALTCLSLRKQSQNKYRLPSFKQIYSGHKFELQQKNLATCSFFHVDEFKLDGEVNVHKTEESFQVLYSIDGDLKLSTETSEVVVKKGRTCLIPAKLTNYKIESSARNKFLRAKVA